MIKKPCNQGDQSDKERAELNEFRPRNHVRIPLSFDWGQRSITPEKTRGNRLPGYYWQHHGQHSTAFYKMQGESGFAVFNKGRFLISKTPGDIIQTARNDILQRLFTQNHTTPNGLQRFTHQRVGASPFRHAEICTGSQCGGRNVQSAFCSLPDSKNSRWHRGK